MPELSKILETYSKEQGLSQPEPEVIDYQNPAEIDRFLKTQYEGINPTEKDFYHGKCHAYRIAAERKVRELKQEKLNQRYKQVTEMWSYQTQYDKAYEVGKAIGIEENFEFVIDEHNQRVFKLLCLYFTNDPKFESYGIGDRKYSLNKGIWLQSPTRGSGKSVMLRCFYQNKRACFGYKHTKELAVKFQKGGFEAIDMFLSPLPQSPSPLNFYQEDCGMMYDEIFSGDDKVMHMGSPLFISDYIINSLYDFSTSKNKNQKWKFHCTSNSSGEDIERISSVNYRSRMADMFNLIKLEGPDRR